MKDNPVMLKKSNSSLVGYGIIGSSCLNRLVGMEAHFSEKIFLKSSLLRNQLSCMFS